MSDDLDELTKAEQRGYANAMEAERKLQEDRIEQLESLVRGQEEQLEIQGNELIRRASHGHKQADRIEQLERENARLDAGWSDANFRALDAGLKLAKAVEVMKALREDMLERSRAGMDTIHGNKYRIVNAGRTAWVEFCATLAELAEWQSNKTATQEFLTEGMIVKGGTNTLSQTTTRPSPPTPLRPKS